MFGIKLWAVFSAVNIDHLFSSTRAQIQSRQPLVKSIYCLKKKKQTAGFSLLYCQSTAKKKFPLLLTLFSFLSMQTMFHNDSVASELAQLACWDRGFESHRRHGYLSVVSVVCCQVEVSATSWSLIQRSPTDCAASLCVI